MLILLKKFVKINRKSNEMLIRKIDIILGFATHSPLNISKICSFMYDKNDSHVTSSNEE